MHIVDCIQYIHVFLCGISKVCVNNTGPQKKIVCARDQSILFLCIFSFDHKFAIKNKEIPVFSEKTWKTPEKSRFHEISGLSFKWETNRNETRAKRAQT